MREQCSCYNNNNICIIQTNSTIHPYNQNVKSKVHQNQPFQKSICYYIRIEERERKRKGRKEEKNGHRIILLLSQNQPKIQTISKCKRSPNYWNSKNRATIRFFEFQKYGLFLNMADFWNSSSRAYLISIPISGIPNIWELHVYQYLAMRVKCQIVP